MDRKLYKFPFRLANTPDWVCPTCGKGILSFKEGSFLQEELTGSANAHSHEAWDPEWISYIYTGVLRCSNEKCKEVVVNSGKGSVSWEVDYGSDGEPETEYVDYFSPKYFEPHLILFNIPESCSYKVKEMLYESFKLFFYNQNASANCVRAAIEELLTELKVKRFNTNAGRRRFLTLHNRIELLPAKFERIKELLMAIKWLGNAASHGHSDLTLDDLMDSYELTEHVLEEIYEPKAKKAQAIAKKVNKKKGPSK